MHARLGLHLSSWLSSGRARSDILETLIRGSLDIYVERARTRSRAKLTCLCVFWLESETGRPCCASMDKPPYKLSSVLLGHTADVRAVATFVDGTVVSASRDKTARVWKPTGLVLSRRKLVRSLRELVTSEFSSLFQFSQSFHGATFPSLAVLSRYYC